MKVVILCGGRGSRMGADTETLPKPMIRVAGAPILVHIMRHYARYGFTDFVLPTGYKGEVIQAYFATNKNWRVQCVDTGLDTMTGGRLRAVSQLLGRNTFMLTYGDGVSDVDLHKLYAFHLSHRGIVTLTAVHPPARFGALTISGDYVTAFKEKGARLDAGWTNGGFMVVEPRALDWIDGDEMWEHAPLEQLARERQINAYQHDGFWQCMDTQRDRELLDELLRGK